jgi:type III secretion protein D
MYELRILSGLHRGATLPLQARPYSVGASEDADVVLVDPDIAATHAHLALHEDGWTLTGADGAVRSAESNRAQTELQLVPGDFARIGNVWITVVDQDASWTNPPPEPAEELFDATAEEDTPAVAAEAESASAEPVATHGSAGAGQSLRTLLLNRSRLAFAALGVVTVGSAAAAYALTAHPPALQAAHATAAPRGATPSRLAEPTIAKAFDTLHTAGAGKRSLTPAELREAFRKRLSDSDLLKRFDLRLQDGQWFMQASLDDEEAARFERILTSFIQTHGIQFPVHAMVGSGESMLPFKIRQVVSGSNASVITQDGNQLYIGDEFRGVRLVAIRGSRLTFAGKRTIEVVW